MRLDRTKFVAWLKKKPLTEIVGMNRDCLSCPIAKFYLSDDRSQIVIFERDCELYVDRGDGGRPLPRWASDFVRKIDDDDDGHISAARALEVLGATSK